jgi:signal peptidase II
VALGLVGGGAIGNLIDRIAFGSVTDFLVFDLGFWPFIPGRPSTSPMPPW